jgi:hypothetical protein
MDWNPASSGKNLSTAESVDQRRIRFTWLQALLPTNGTNPTFSTGAVPEDIPIAQATRSLEAHYGPAFQKPLENCELLPDGTLYGYSYGELTAPISTSTVPTTSVQTTP